MKHFRHKQIFALLAIGIFLCSCNLFVEKDIDFIPEGAQVIEMDKAKLTMDDGDSFFYDSLGIRVLGMDTPEIAHPEHGFDEDQAYGREAEALTALIFEGAGNVSYLAFQKDGYGRMLAHVFIDGDLLSIKLIRAGLAYETVSHYGDNGFPQLAERILKAAEESQTKEFIPPHQWRRANRKAVEEQPGN
ncbi:MAG: thermonuclease family protein [candidate division Zixibacteria bacterium]|nr:thermonuclease family protein [candidate division Zixibacteria bacterium]